MARTIEPEIALGRRAFQVAQDGFRGGADSTIGTVEIGWYDTSVDPERGCFALIDRLAPTEVQALIGEIIGVQLGQDAIVYAYVLGSAPLTFDLCLNSHVMNRIAPLSRRSIDATVTVTV